MQRLRFQAGATATRNRPSTFTQAGPERAEVIRGEAMIRVGPVGSGKTGPLSGLGRGTDVGGDDSPSCTRATTPPCAPYAVRVSSVREGTTNQPSGVS